MSSKTPFLQNLDTTFVNLWSLLRKLTAQGFIGRVHVDLGDYSADIYLNGSNTPLVREIDRATNSETIEEGALHRVVLRTRESAGLINVFSGADEATVQPLAPPSQPQRARNQRPWLKASPRRRSSVLLSQRRRQSSTKTAAKNNAQRRLISRSPR